VQLVGWLQHWEIGWCSGSESALRRELHGFDSLQKQLFAFAGVNLSPAPSGCLLAHFAMCSDVYCCEARQTLRP
jgi:hypothetical protein